MTVIVPSRPARPIRVDGGGRIPAGGTTGQALVKSADADYATAWATISGGGGGVSDGDKGDITVSGSGTVWTIDDGAVTPAKTTGFAAIAVSGSASDLGAGTLPAARFDDTAHGTRAGGTLHANVVAAGAAGFMTGADKTKLDAITGTNTGDQTITLTGDVTGSGTGSFAATVAANAVGNTKLADMAANTIKGNATAATADPADIAVGTNTVLGRVAGNIVAAQLVDAQVAAATLTNAKLANVATATLKGRTTAGTGSPEDLTGTQATTLLDTFTTSLKGLAPASGGGTANFLRADGTWAAPAGGGGGGVTQGQVIAQRSNVFLA